MENTQQQKLINSPSGLFAIILISIVGVAVFIIQPGFVQGLVEYRGFSESQAGFTASVEMWGIAIATLIISFFSKRLNWRYCSYVAVTIMATANYFSSLPALADYFLALRGLAGLGSGILISLGFVIMGLSAKPDRNFALMILWILIYAAAAFYLLPLAYHGIGFDGVLVSIALFSLCPLLLIHRLPVNAPASSHEIKSVSKNSLKISAVATLFIYFLAQGVVWAYLFLMGTAAGITEAAVAQGLSLAQFTGVAGALLAVVVANRYGRIKPLATGIGLSITALALILNGDFTVVVYILSVCLFNLAWNMTHPYLLAVLAELDLSGRLVAIGVSAQMLGLAIGPALAAVVLTGQSGYFNVLLLAMVLFAVAGVLIIMALRQATQA